jgi:hypothetical protein
LTKLGSTKVLNSYMIGAFSALEGGPLDSKNLQQALSKILDSERDADAFRVGAESLG